MIFAITIALNLKLKQIDVKTAFYMEQINKELYVKQPTGLEDWR